MIYRACKPRMRPAGRAPTLALPGRGHPRADLWSCRRTSTRAIRAPEAIKSIAHLVDLTRVAYGPRIANSYGYVWTRSSAQYAAVVPPHAPPSARRHPPPASPRGVERRHLRRRRPAIAASSPRSTLRPGQPPVHGRGGDPSPRSQPRRMVAMPGCGERAEFHRAAAAPLASTRSVAFLAPTPPIPTRTAGQRPGTAPSPQSARSVSHHRLPGPVGQDEG
jgi:hypothetical protein